TDAAGEGFVLKLLFHRSGFDFVNAFRRLDEGTRGKETGQFIAREKSAIERRDARNAGIAGMAKDRVNDFLGVTALTENLRAFVGMLFRRVMLGIWPALVIKIVKQAGEAPGVFVAAELSGIGANAGFDGESMFEKAFALRVFAEKI